MPSTTTSPSKPSTVEAVTENVKSTVTYVATAVDPYVPTVAKDAAGYVFNTASSVSNSVFQTAAAAQTYATQRAQDAVEFGKGVVTGATTTLQAYTPDPVMTLLNNTMNGAQALRSDPVGTVKPYVPSFVVQVGEKTYEVVSHTTESAKRTAEETSGFIVTKVNGTVDYITHIPQVEKLITELHKLVPSKKETTPSSPSS